MGKICAVGPDYLRVPADLYNEVGESRYVPVGPSRPAARVVRATTAPINIRLQFFQPHYHSVLTVLMGSWSAMKGAHASEAYAYCN